MKIREVLDKNVRNTKYFKYLITLPKEIVQNSKLIGKDLRAKTENGKIIIEKEQSV